MSAECKEKSSPTASRARTQTKILNDLTAAHRCLNGNWKLLDRSITKTHQLLDRLRRNSTTKDDVRIELMERLLKLDDHLITTMEAQIEVQEWIGQRQSERILPEIRRYLLELQAELEKEWAREEAADMEQ